MMFTIGVVSSLLTVGVLLIGVALMGVLLAVEFVLGTAYIATFIAKPSLFTKKTYQFRRPKLVYRTGPFLTPHHA